MENDNWRGAWHVGYEFNKSMYRLQCLGVEIPEDLSNSWVCDNCNKFVVSGYLCRCTRNNPDDLRYQKDKEDGKFKFGK